MTRPIALVVDDHAMNAKLVSFVLRARGLDVVTAASATEVWKALEAIAPTAPAVILMDIQLPEVDGLTLTQMLRRDARFTRTPIVAVTAYAMARDKAAAIDAGCTAFVAKPIDPRALGELVVGLLDGGEKGAS